MDAQVKTRRIHPADTEWEMFHDPHGRPTSPVRMLKTDAPALLEVDFPPNFYAGLHWHPFDTLYFVAEGEMKIGPEGSFFPGDIRWVKAGYPYGPEEAGPDGVRFFLISMGDEVGLNWADIYDTPQELENRLATFPERFGRVNLDELPASELAEGCRIRTICDTEPWMHRLEMSRGRCLARPITHDVDALYMVRAGSVEIPGEGGFALDDFRWVDGGHTTSGMLAGPDGADIILIGATGSAAFEWAAG